MSLQRRRLLQGLSYAVGAGFLFVKNASVVAAQDAAQQSTPDAKAGPGKPESNAPESNKSESSKSGGTQMEKVAGIGGLFFRAHDPKSLGKWYEQHLGISLTPTSEGGSVWQQEAGPTSFSPFPETTKYFGDPNKAYMVNFRVHDMDKMVAQLRAAGVEVKDPETYAGIGKFTRLHDPEGNPIELWQPA